jgi:hypothetical protein
MALHMLDKAAALEPRNPQVDHLMSNTDVHNGKASPRKGGHDSTRSDVLMGRC